MSNSILKGKKGIIFGALDDSSIAWKTAEKVFEEGGEFILTNAPVSVRMGTINELAEKTNSEVIPADATNLEDLEKLISHTSKKFNGKLDFVLHSIGMSVNVRKGKHYTDLNYDWLAKGWDVSAVSFHKLMQSLLKLDAMKDVKETNRLRIEEYVQYDKDSIFSNTGSIWDIKCDIALPCATQNELEKKHAELLVRDGLIAIAEGANMPCTPEAVEVFHKNKIPFGPGKASNAGGVAVSGLEMSQNSLRDSWSFDKVDKKLQGIMKNIHDKSYEASETYNDKGNYVMGANIVGFQKVANAMISQGIV